MNFNLGRKKLFHKEWNAFINTPNLSSTLLFPGQEVNKTRKLLTVINGLYGLEREWIEASKVSLDCVITIASTDRFNLSDFWLYEFTTELQSQRYVLVSYWNDPIHLSINFRKEVLNSLKTAERGSKVSSTILVSPNDFLFIYRNQFGLEQQWLPFQFHINENKQVSSFEFPWKHTSSYFSFLCERKEEILPLFTSDLISYYSQIFTSMLPSFEQILGSNLENHSLQVFMKIKVDRVWTNSEEKEKEEEKDKFSCEGVESEHIKAIGMYCLFTDSTKIGEEDNSIEFVHEMTSQQKTNLYTSKIPITSNQFIVWNNDGVCYHLSPSKRKLVSSSSSCPAERWIIYFYLVDPHIIISSFSSFSSSSSIPTNKSSLEEQIVHRIDNFLLHNLTLEEQIALKKIFLEKRELYCTQVNPFYKINERRKEEIEETKLFILKQDLQKD